MLSELQKERDRLIARVRAGESGDLENAYICHRQQFGLTTDLHTLTRDHQFAGFWSLAPFGVVHLVPGGGRGV